MKSIGYYNGSYSELGSMYVPMNDRVCAFGDGVYDAAYCYNGRIFAFDEHLDRFFASAQLIGLNIEETKEDISKIIYYLINQVEEDKLFVYWQATRGTQPREHVFDDGIKANIWIMIKPSELRSMERPAKVMLCEDKRHHMCNVKTLNLLPNVIALKEADRKGLDEVIFHRNRRITECGHSNVSVLSNGILITPPADELILAGIGRAHLMKKCKEFGIPCVEKEFFIEDLLSADEIIMTAAGSLCIDVGEINGKAVGGKDCKRLSLIRNALIKEFCDYTGAEIKLNR